MKLKHKDHIKKRRVCDCGQPAVIVRCGQNICLRCSKLERRIDPPSTSRRPQQLDYYTFGSHRVLTGQQH